MLATLVDMYESRHFPIGAPDPVEAILLRMEQLGPSRKDLEPLLGSSDRVSEVLNSRRTTALPPGRAAPAAKGDDHHVGHAQG